MKAVIDGSTRHIRSRMSRGARFLAVALCLCATPAVAQSSFSSGSDGSDGIYAPSGSPGTIIVFDPTKFSGSQVAANIFNFASILIPAGVTIQFPGDKINGPIVWLSQGDVVIQGTLDLSGGAGHSYSGSPFTRVPSAYGAGGYRGEIGGNPTQVALPGDGPTGGTAGVCSGGTSVGGGGTFPGNTFLIPLIGGSGGGGTMYCGSGAFGPGGGGGGGAILIASSTKISIVDGGVINVNGGNGGVNYNVGGGGSAGAIRLVANVISTSGTTRFSAIGGCGYNSQSPYNGSAGVMRFEAFSLPLGGNISSVGGTCGGNATIQESSPFPLLLATAGRPSASVISINGVAITPNPSTFPDITINTTAAVPVVIRTHNVPTTATVTLTILDQNGVADTSFQAPALSNCDQNNFCTTSVNVVFPFGASRGLTKVTWTP